MDNAMFYPTLITSIPNTPTYKFVLKLGPARAHLTLAMIINGVEVDVLYINGYNGKIQDAGQREKIKLLTGLKLEYDT